MERSVSHIKAALEKEIIQYTGSKPFRLNQSDPGVLSLIRSAFPQNRFPTGVIHEFMEEGFGGLSASQGFITALLSVLLPPGGITACISPHPLIFPPALRQFGLSPEQFLFFHPSGLKDQFFVLEECLKSKAVSVVIGYLPDISLTESRRLQLAVEQSRVTGMIIRQKPRNQTTASFARWRITSRQTRDHSGLPGITFPCWKVELLKIRNGKPGSWEMEWRDGKLNLLDNHSYPVYTELRKII